MTEKYPVIDTETGYWEALERLEAGSGPVAVDAERASGFKFSQRAYLIQLYREGSGTILFDPPAIGSLAEVTDVIGDEEWIFHAASQDLACLREVGMNPQRIFDTELAGRLLGMPRVALGTVVEELLGIHLKKEHSAADWSTRPLPESWLEYAALDVELLPQLREAMAKLLDESGKASIAEQEFQAVLDKPANPPRVDPWRRLSGLSRLRTPRALAVARSLWLARDAYAREVDVSPGRLLPDSSIVAVSAAAPATISALAGTREFTGRASRTELSRWWAAIENGVKVAELPEMRPARERGVLPHPKNWADRNPGAADRLASAKVVLAALSESLKIPQENIVSPETVRQLSWNVGDDGDLERIVALLRQHGARDWQIDAVAQPLLVAFVENGQEAATELNPDS